MLTKSKKQAIEVAKDFGVEVKDFNVITLNKVEGEMDKMDKKRLTGNWNL